MCNAHSIVSRGNQIQVLAGEGGDAKRIPRGSEIPRAH